MLGNYFKKAKEQKRLVRDHFRYLSHYLEEGIDMGEAITLLKEGFPQNYPHEQAAKIGLYRMFSDQLIEVDWQKNTYKMTKRGREVLEQSDNNGHSLEDNSKDAYT